MKKLVIFNVGGALSCFGDIDDNVFLVDLGKSSEFSPVADFLLPLAYQRGFRRDTSEGNRYKFNQLFLSHLDDDHTSDYLRFDENFASYYMTCPSDNPTMGSKFRVNSEKLGEMTEAKEKILSEMRGRNPSSEGMPIRSITPNTHLSFIVPQDVEQTEELNGGYANNISLVLFIEYGDKTVLLPGDLYKEGMKHLIETNWDFKNMLEEKGVDYLIAPHHGLSTSFSSVLFETIKGNKTRLNIISEKTRKADSEESRSSIDGRYRSEDYCTGDNALGQYSVMTSQGHIVIDLESDESDVKQYTDIDDVLAEFF